MLAEITPQQLGEWLAYYRIDPWGEIRADLRNGIVASVIANVNRDSRRQQTPFTPADFMPKFDPEVDRPALAAKARAVFFALPGRKAGKPKA